jgi:Ca2+-binding EF-hand superfamily protein
MDTLINEFVEQFSQAYFDGFDEKMEEVDIEEFVKIIEEKLREHNECGKLA